MRICSILKKFATEISSALAFSPMETVDPIPAQVLKIVFD